MTCTPRASVLPLIFTLFIGLTIPGAKTLAHCSTRMKAQRHHHVLSFFVALSARGIASI